MSIKIEFNSDLALQCIAEHKSGNRKIEECIPEPLEVGKVYDFIKIDKGNYCLVEEVPLLEIRGNEIISQPRASVVIIKARHLSENENVYTVGKYKVLKIFGNNDPCLNGQQ